MDYQLNRKNIPSSNRTFPGNKLQYQEEAFEQASLAPMYLTTDCAWKTVTDGAQRQEMELKNLGTIKRKQFLQTREISRSHEMNIMRNSHLHVNYRLSLRTPLTDFRRQSSVHDYKLPNTLSLAVTDEETGDLSATRLSISNSLTSVHKQCEDEDAEAANKLLDIGRVASWAVGFEKLLNDQIGLYVFTEFLKKEFSQENIQFWIECEKLKALIEPDEIRQKANSIWSTYLHDTDDGSCRINIDSRTRQECHQALATKPHAHTFEKAQSQIFQLMKLDSYTRFLKSNMYKDCIMSEMEGKSIPYTKPAPASNEERSKTIDCLAKLKEEEKKDKKRSPLLPWTKAFIKWKRLSVKRDTPTSLSNYHQPQLMETYNSSMTNKSASVELTPLANLMKIPPTAAAPSTSSLSLQSSTPSLGKFSKHLSNLNQQDSSSFNFILRSDTNPDLPERKLLLENSLSPSIDSSRFCRFIFPDSTSAVLLVNKSTSTIQQAINRLFAKRGLTWYRTELYSSDQQPVDIHERLSSLCGKEIRVEPRILIRIEFPTKILCVKCEPKRTLIQVLLPIFVKLKYSLKHFVFYANDSLTPLNLNEIIGSYDNQRILTLTRTAAGVDLINRQKIRLVNDIFDMISEYDEDIQFDECGILKVVTHSKSTFVMSTDNSLHSPTPETPPTPFENDQIYCGPRR